MCQREAACKLQISQCPSNKISKSPFAPPEAGVVSNSTKSRKRKRTGKDEGVESALTAWFCEVRKKDARVNIRLLKS